MLKRFLSAEEHNFFTLLHKHSYLTPLHRVVQALLWLGSRLGTAEGTETLGVQSAALSHSSRGHCVSQQPRLGCHLHYPACPLALKARCSKPRESSALLALACCGWRSCLVIQKLHTQNPHTLQNYDHIREPSQPNSLISKIPIESWGPYDSLMFIPSYHSFLILLWVESKALKR